MYIVGSRTVRVTYRDLVLKKKQDEGRRRRVGKEEERALESGVQSMRQINSDKGGRRQEHKSPVLK